MCKKKNTRTLVTVNKPKITKIKVNTLLLLFTYFDNYVVVFSAMIFLLHGNSILNIIRILLSSTNIEYVLNFNA